MNFKIENRVMNITNYPFVARHLEDMASRGWLLNKIVLGNIFIYKKIKSENLDFAITPYEVETEFTRKSKEELEEFQTICEMIGWNYATKSNDFHVYFKDKDSQAIDIETDEEDEFNTIERIGKKGLRGNYIITPLMVYLAWIILGNLFKDVDSLKNGMGHIVGLLAVVFIVSLINDIVKTKIFLKESRKNIEIGKKIEFNGSKFYFEKIIFSLYFLFTTLFIGYSLYIGFVLKNRIILIALIPALLSMIIGFFYRRFIKTSKKRLIYKKTFFVIIMISIFFISTSILVFNTDKLISQANNRDIDGYRVLLANDFTDKHLEEEKELWEDFSIIIPKSYKFTSRSDEYNLVTEYSNAITISIAKKLVKIYIKQEEDWVIRLNSNELDHMFEKDEYIPSLYFYGFKEEDFTKLRKLDKKEAKKKAEKLILEKSIIKDTENLWNMDDAYFLNYEKEAIVIRKGKEVFYLVGKNFSDPKIIKLVKEKLALN